MRVLYLKSSKFELAGGDCFSLSTKFAMTRRVLGNLGVVKMWISNENGT